MTKPRLFRGHASYVVLATACLVLSIGPTVAVFTVVNALWLRPLPFPDANRLVMLVSNQTGGSADNSAFFGAETSGTWAVFEDVAGQVVSSGQLAGLRPRIVLTRLGHEVETVGVTSRYFRVLGLPIRGRDFTRDDNRFGAEPVALISDRLWSSAFDRDEDIIGALTDATPFPIRVVGVAPPGFVGARHGDRADMWIPANLVPRVAPAGDLPEHGVPTLILGRLRRGETAVEAGRRLVREAANDRERAVKERIKVVPLDRVFGAPEARTIVMAEGRAAAMVAGLAGLVLLAGCTTLMALVLVHYERRRRELSVRLALGASRRHLITGMIRDLSWPAAGGLGGAFLLATWSLRTLPSFSLPGGVDLGRLDLSIDWRVLGAGSVATVVTLLASAFVPVIRFTRNWLAGELIASSATPPVSSHRLRQILLSVHVAATIVVLVVAGLFVRAVVHAFSGGAGFDVDRTVFVQVHLAPPFVSESTDLKARQAAVESRRRRLADGLLALPGADVVARGSAPIGPDASSLLLAQRTFVTGGEVRDVRVGFLSGDPHLFQALGLTLLRGRALAAADTSARPKPILVTDSLARTLWPNDDPLGQGLTTTAGARGSTSTVVGVVSDVAYGSLSLAPAGVVIAASAVSGGSAAEFVVRAERPEQIVEPIRQLVRRTAADAPRVSVATGREILAQDMGRQRLGAWVFSGFGLIAFVLGAGGGVGLVAYLAESRRREFGVRLALGATPGDVMHRGAVAGLAPVAIGVVVGLPAAALVARTVVAVLPGLSFLDATIYAVVSLLIVGGTAVAALAAAWRLRSVDPVDALRAE